MGKLSEEIAAEAKSLYGPRVSVMLDWADRAAALEAESPADLIAAGWIVRIDFGVYVSAYAEGYGPGRSSHDPWLVFSAEEHETALDALTELRRQIEEVG